MLNHMLRHTLGKRVFSDKDIGRSITRFYTIGQSEWDKYNKQINNTYSPNFRHLDSVLTDTVVSQSDKIRDLSIAHFRHSEEIRDLKITARHLNQNYLHIKEDLYQLTKEMGKINNNIAHNHKELGEVLFLLAVEVKKVSMLLENEKRRKY